MKKNTIAFYPYVDSGSQSYIRNMEDILKNCGAKLLPYIHGVKTIPNMFRSKYIFLNWFENDLTILDRSCIVLAGLLGKKVIWTFHNKVPHDSPDYAVAKENISFMARFATHILILSHNSRKELKEVAGGSVLKKTVYMPHIHYCNVYKPTGKSENDGTLSKEFVFLYFGLVRPYKNIELLIEAFTISPIPNAKLLIAGKPSDVQYAKKIKELCKKSDNIELDLHYIPDQKVYQYMQKADAIVLPYDKKSSMNSGAMIAAFSCKKPVIVPDIAMARDYTDKEYVYRYGYKNVTEHVERLCDAMKQAYSQGKEKNTAFGETAYQDVLEKNSEKMVLKSLEQIW